MMWLEAAGVYKCAQCSMALLPSNTLQHAVCEQHTIAYCSTGVYCFSVVVAAYVTLIYTLRSVYSTFM
jgi:hypothetical protein